MNVILRPDWTLDQFLDWERRQDARHEFDGTSVIEMNGGTLAHDEIRRRLTRLLEDRIAGPARVWGPDVQVHTGGRVRYPDLVVTLTTQDRRSRRVVDPVVIFEVLSDSTEQTDLTRKLAEYMRLASVLRYVMLSQDEVMALVVTRAGDGWLLREHRDGAIELPEIGAALPLADIYRDLGRL